MKTTYTLQRGSRNSTPAGWEDVITTDNAVDANRRYLEFSHACRCSDAFRVIDSAGKEYDMDEFQMVSIDATFSVFG